MLLTLASCSTMKNHERLERNEARHQQALAAMHNGSFVLEAHSLTFRNGGMASVSSGTNFISLNRNIVTIQTAFNNGRPGINNLGGITLVGTPGQIRTHTDRRGNVTYRFNAMGSFLSAQVEIILYAGTNEAIATIRPNFNGNRLTMRGRIVPANQSVVFPGRPI